MVWKFPVHRYKLNTDGSSRGNSGEAAGGGILRDTYGSTIFVFHDFFGIKTSLQAEALALLFGLSICNALNIQDIEVECDSSFLISMARGTTSIPWKLRGIFRKMQGFSHRVAYYSHCYQEANCVADALANLGQESKYFLFSHMPVNVPSSIKAYIQQDYIGLCNLRFS